MHRNAGFTLIEMLIVVSVIGILAGTAVPNLLSGRSTANEKVILATMRTISSAQMQFKTLGLLDINRDGSPEYGTLGEMSGTMPLRSDGTSLDPTLLSVNMGSVDANGRNTRNGYHFAIYLPDAAGDGMPETPAGLANVDDTLAQNYFTCLAWSSTLNTTGNRRVYFINQQGEVLSTKDPSYAGANAPPPGAALIGTANPNQIVSQGLAINAVGADGNTWMPVH